MKYHKLMIKQLDRLFIAGKAIQRFKRPPEGWIRTIRKALGMTTKQLAGRLGLKYARVIQLELAETKDAVTLRALREAAAAMDCELIYAVVPKKPLEKILEERANQIAAQYTDSASHMMALEGQSISIKLQEEARKEYAKSLLEGSLKKLWEN